MDIFLEVVLHQYFEGDIFPKLDQQYEVIAKQQIPQGTVIGWYSGLCKSEIDKEEYTYAVALPYHGYISGLHHGNYLSCINTCFPYGKVEKQENENNESLIRENVIFVTYYHKCRTQYQPMIFIIAIEQINEGDIVWLNYLLEKNDSITYMDLTGDVSVELIDCDDEYETHRSESDDTHKLTSGDKGSAPRQNPRLKSILNEEKSTPHALWSDTWNSTTVAVLIDIRTRLKNKILTRRPNIKHLIEEERTNKMKHNSCIMSEKEKEKVEIRKARNRDSAKRFREKKRQEYLTITKQLESKKNELKILLEEKSPNTSLNPDNQSKPNQTNKDPATLILYQSTKTANQTQKTKHRTYNSNNNKIKDIKKDHQSNQEKHLEKRRKNNDALKRWRLNKARKIDCLKKELETVEILLNTERKKPGNGGSMTTWQK